MHTDTQQAWQATKEAPIATAFSLFPTPCPSVKHYHFQGAVESVLYLSIIKSNCLSPVRPSLCDLRHRLSAFFEELLIVSTNLRQLIVADSVGMEQRFRFLIGDRFAVFVSCLYTVERDYVSQFDTERDRGNYRKSIPSIQIDQRRADTLFEEHPERRESGRIRRPQSEIQQIEQFLYTISKPLIGLIWKTTLGPRVYTIIVGMSNDSVKIGEDLVNIIIVRTRNNHCIDYRVPNMLTNSILALSDRIGIGIQVLIKQPNQVLPLFPG